MASSVVLPRLSSCGLGCEHIGLVAVVHGLSCSTARGISVP